MMHPHSKVNQSVTNKDNTIRRNSHTPISFKFLQKFTHKLLLAISLNLSSLKFFSIQNILCPSKPYDELDPKIKNLVKAMNASSVIKTIASCEGHGLRGLYPYVYFKSSVKTASQITRMLRQHYIRNLSCLNYQWVLDGKFDHNNELTFLFYSPELSRASESTLRSLIQFYFFREKIDQDFDALQKLLFKHT